MVSQSEWVFWEALGLIVGKLGIVALSVHTIPNQTIMALCMVSSVFFLRLMRHLVRDCRLVVLMITFPSCTHQVPFAFGVAVAIRMGVSLPLSVRRTQWIVLTTTAGSAVLFGVLTVLVYFRSDVIISIFTTNDVVKELAHAIWYKVCLFSMNVSIFGILAGVATGLGLQWSLGVINLVWLWAFGLPVIYYSAIMKDGGLQSVWTWINVPYLAMNLCLIFLFSITDWYKVQERIIKKDSGVVLGTSEMEPTIRPTNEASSLLNP